MDREQGLDGGIRKAAGKNHPAVGEPGIRRNGGRAQGCWAMASGELAGQGDDSTGHGLDVGVPLER
jgi:hypothetical protein